MILNRAKWNQNETCEIKAVLSPYFKINGKSIDFDAERVGDPLKFVLEGIAFLTICNFVAFEVQMSIKKFHPDVFPKSLGCFWKNIGMIFFFAYGLPQAKMAVFGHLLTIICYKTQSYSKINKWRKFKVIVEYLI